MRLLDDKWGDFARFGFYTWLCYDILYTTIITISLGHWDDTQGWDGLSTWLKIGAACTLVKVIKIFSTKTVTQLCQFCKARIFVKH